MAKKMYMCCMCEELHERESDAEECCQPEVEEVYVCEVCGEQHDIEQDADDCCPAGEKHEYCPSCYRDLDVLSLDRAAVAIAGHCQICNPKFSYDEQFAIEDLHYERTGKHERVNA